MKKLESSTGEDYNYHWSYTDYKDKVVLELGADWGTSVYWLLQQGASKVIAVEGYDDSFQKLLENVKDDSNVVPLKIMIESSENYNYLIGKYKPDIVKIDIEGAEKFLLEANPDILKEVPVYLIETHTADLFTSIAYLLTRLGYKVSYCTQIAFAGADPAFGSVDVLKAEK
jgi:precorrin-6B methylase 2